MVLKVINEVQVIYCAYCLKKVRIWRENFIKIRRTFWKKWEEKLAIQSFFVYTNFCCDI